MHTVPDFFLEPQLVKSCAKLRITLPQTLTPHRWELFWLRPSMSQRNPSMNQVRRGGCGLKGRDGKRNCKWKQLKKHDVSSVTSQEPGYWGQNVFWLYFFHGLLEKLCWVKPWTPDFRKHLSESVWIYGAKLRWGLREAPWGWKWWNDGKETALCNVSEIKAGKHTCYYTPKQPPESGLVDLLSFFPMYRFCRCLLYFAILCPKRCQIRAWHFGQTVVQDSIFMYFPSNNRDKKKRKKLRQATGRELADVAWALAKLQLLGVKTDGRGRTRMSDAEIKRFSKWEISKEIEEIQIWWHFS